MSPVTVVIPWRPTVSRRPILVWMLDRLSYTSMSVVLGSIPVSEPWCKARAVANGINAVPDAEIIVVHDADCWSGGLLESVRAVRSGDFSWAIPHTMVRRLKQTPTKQTLSSGLLLSGPLERKPYVGVPGGGVVVLRRDLWDRCPIDQRFVGWGQEDESWGLALRKLAGDPFRSSHDLVHLWHDPQDRMTSSIGSPESRHLHSRYQAACSESGTDSLLALIREGRTEDGWRVDSSTTL